MIAPIYILTVLLGTLADHMGRKPSPDKAWFALVEDWHPKPLEVMVHEPIMDRVKYEIELNDLNEVSRPERWKGHEEAIYQLYYASFLRNNLNIKLVISFTAYPLTLTLTKNAFDLRVYMKFFYERRSPKYFLNQVKLPVNEGNIKLFDNAAYKIAPNLLGLTTTQSRPLTPSGMHSLERIMQTARSCGWERLERGAHMDRRIIQKLLRPDS